jgi:hypothetical protein
MHRTGDLPGSLRRRGNGEKKKEGNGNNKRADGLHNATPNVLMVDQNRS